MADFIMLILRVLHILLGAFWVGGAVTAAVFVAPAVRNLGPNGGAFMQQFIERRKFGMYMTIAGDITVLTGLAFLGHNMASEMWRASTYGQVMMLGSALGVVALGIGHGVNAPTSKKLSALGARLQAAGGPPSPDALAEMGRLQKRLETGSRVGALLLVLTVVCMAAARNL